MTEEFPGARVVIVAPVHQYDDIRIFHKEAKSLARSGYDVRLLARAPRSLEEDGVRVVPLPQPSGRLARFARLPLVLKRALAENGHIYHLHNPDTIPLALVLRLLGKRVVYDTHEDFAKRLLVRKWIPRPLRRSLARIVSSAEALVARLVDLSVVTQPAVRDRLSGNTLLLENAPIAAGALIEAAHAHSRYVERLHGAFRLVYVGRITRPRGLVVMLDSLVLANQRVPCRLWLIGTFNEGDQPYAERHPGWRFVDYLGPLQQAQAFAHISRADAGMVTILDVGDHAHTSPNKLFEYQTFGIPFIASDFSHWRRVMEGVDAGLWVNPADANDVAAAVTQLADDPEMVRRLGERGRQFVERYNWELESQKLLDAYRLLLPSRGDLDRQRTG